MTQDEGIFGVGQGASSLAGLLIVFRLAPGANALFLPSDFLRHFVSLSYLPLLLLSAAQRES
jgi:hypothetical protein